MKVVHDKCKKNITGLVRLGIGFFTAEFPSQSDIENNAIRCHIDFPLTLPKDGNNQSLIRFIHAIIFLGERGLAFQGSLKRIGDSTWKRFRYNRVAFQLGPHSKGTCAKGGRVAEKG